MAPDHEPMRRQARIASIVILVTFVGWMGASYFGGQLGLPTRYAFLLDMAALAALFWAMVVMFQVWRARQRDEEDDDARR